MLTSLLFAGSLLAAAPAPAHMAPPSIFSGRRVGWQPRAAPSVLAPAPDGTRVAVRCKSEAPSILSGRTKNRPCPLEEVNPRFVKVAPSIFSGRPPKRGNVIVGQAALQPTPVRSTVTYSAETGQYVTTPITAPGYSATGEVQMQVQPKRRAPSIFSGRAPRKRPAQ